MMPTFTGEPQSRLIKVTLPGSAIDLWQWGPIQKGLPKDLNVTDRLVGAGYEQVHRAKGKSLFASLMSQCCDLVYVSPHNGEGELWARPEDVQRADQCPVILVFQLPQITQAIKSFIPEASPPEVESIPMLQYLPPPQLGECAIIAEGETRAFYRIDELPEEGQAVWRDLGDALRTLAAPGTWVPFKPFTMGIVFDPIVYHRTITDFRSAILSSKGKPREDAKKALAGLESMHEEVEKVLAAQQKKDWQVQWQRIQLLTKELATAYWELHTLKSISTPPPAVETLPEPIPGAPKRPRKKHQSPVALVTKNPKEIYVKSDVLSTEVMRGLLDPKDYTQYPDRQIAEYRRSFAKERGEIIITITLQSDEVWEDVLRYLNTLGDEIVDTYIALMAIAIDTHGAQHLTLPFYVSPDDILEVCQRQKSKGSYTPHQRLTITEHLQALSRATVQATMPAPTYTTRKKPTEYRV